MDKICAVILAAGEGKRMKSSGSKVMHEIMFKPVAGWVYDAVLKADISDICFVVGHCREEVVACFNEASFAVQEEQLGTGHAIMQARDYILNSKAGHVLVLTGDTPLLTEKTLKGLITTHIKEKNKLTVLTAELPDATGYGRIVRDDAGTLCGIVEHKDASVSELLIREINSGVYCFETEFLLKALPSLKNNNSQGEYYLTDVVSCAVNGGEKAGAYLAQQHEEVLGINDRKQLLEATDVIKNRILDYHMENGVTIMDRGSVMIGEGVEIGIDTVIMPSTIIKGKTKIGKGCTIGPFSVIHNAEIGDRVSFNASQITDSKIGDNVNVGPYAYIRPGCDIGSNCKIGDFVELKAASVGQGTKIPHLSYVGDAIVGERVNFGCGCVTVNYNGQIKQKTEVSDGAFIGCNTNLVAPVKIGKDAYTAAGSTITKDVPDGALAIERGEQQNKEGWVQKKFGK